VLTINEILGGLKLIDVKLSAVRHKVYGEKLNVLNSYFNGAADNDNAK